MVIIFFSSSVAFLEVIEMIQIEVIATDNCSKEKRGSTGSKCNVIRTFRSFQIGEIYKLQQSTFVQKRKKGHLNLNVML